MTFQEIKINQRFYTSNGRPSIKVSGSKAKSLVPICISPCTNGYADEGELFKVSLNEPVYI